MSSSANLSFYENKRILVTGAGGFIGSAVAKILSAVDCRLELAFRKSITTNFHPSKASIQHRVLNIMSEDSWHGLADIDIIFHFAEHDYREEEPSAHLKGSAHFMLHLLERCTKVKTPPKIVFASSSNLVGNPKTPEVDDQFPDHPVTMYAIHKLLAENYLNYYAREYNIPSVTLRLVNVYGPASEQNVALRAILNSMIHSAMKKGGLELFKNRACIRDFVFIDDVVEAFLLAGSSTALSSGEHYIIGSGESLSLESIIHLIAEKVEEETRRRPTVKINEAREIQPIEMRSLVANSTRFRELTGWKAGVTLSQGIARTIRSMAGAAYENRR